MSLCTERAMTFRALADRIADHIAAEDFAWMHNPHLRRTIEGHPHLLVRRGDKLVPVALPELTWADFDNLAERRRA